jgi:hypothetical protein
MYKVYINSLKVLIIENNLQLIIKNNKNPNYNN